MDLKVRPIRMNANTWYKAKQGDVITYVYPTGCQEFYEIRISTKKVIEKKIANRISYEYRRYEAWPLV